MKAIIEKYQFFTVWKYGDKVRIIKDKTNKGFYPYVVQKLLDEKRYWLDYGRFHNLREAKEEAMWLAEDIKMDTERMD